MVNKLDKALLELLAQHGYFMELVREALYNEEISLQDAVLIAELTDNLIF